MTAVVVAIVSVKRLSVRHDILQCESNYLGDSISTGKTVRSRFTAAG